MASVPTEGPRALLKAKGTYFSETDLVTSTHDSVSKPAYHRRVRTHTLRHHPRHLSNQQPAQHCPAQHHPAWHTALYTAYWACNAQTTALPGQQPGPTPIGLTHCLVSLRCPGQHHAGSAILPHPNQFTTLPNPSGKGGYDVILAWTFVGRHVGEEVAGITSYLPYY